ncbi:DUF2938 domain-containing protein [Viridibacterium curvum]|uniref:DUF2938 domain-containing protein n=1 Tax=Viridibacterium curvum TaxID=1101404 RepID=A0ABP9QQC4_9RHOO
MESLGHILTNTLLIGIGATAITDLWALLRRRLLGVALPDYGLVGRWFAHMPRGHFRHEAIARVEAVAGESLIGWAAHYLTGMAFAALLVALCGPAWLQSPRLASALLFGLVTVAAPFLLMQPGMGAGIAASRTPRPNAARLQSLITHAVFGCGLYASALLIRVITDFTPAS